MSGFKVISLLDLDSLFCNDKFNIKLWEEYLDSNIPEIKKLIIEDMNNTINCGYSYDNDILPIISLAKDKKKRDEVLESFSYVTNDLDSKIINFFGKSLDVTIILTLGLCNGAGWVFEINGNQYVLLGIEKILELNWYSKHDMYGLIYHELGHIYQNQFGILNREFNTYREHFLWQLFTEGVAMVFEQRLLNNDNFFHQDINGWLSWCQSNISEIILDFDRDISIMTPENQRYFGDWVRYKNHSDVGYFLGAKFVQFILRNNEFDDILCYSIQDIAYKWDLFKEKYNK